jgi:hypothetical protein
VEVHGEVFERDVLGFGVEGGEGGEEGDEGGAGLVVGYFCLVEGR